MQSTLTHRTITCTDKAVKGIAESGFVYVVGWLHFQFLLQHTSVTLFLSLSPFPSLPSFHSHFLTPLSVNTFDLPYDDRSSTTSKDSSLEGMR